jgi:hypothetical protein
MNLKAPSNLLDDIARDSVPEDLNLLPGVLAKVQKMGKRPMTASVKWVMAVVLLAVFLTVAFIGVPRVAAAVKALLGYIPGVGVVAQDAPIRVLEGPVSITREGVTVTVRDAIITSNKTMVEFPVFSGVPVSAYPSESGLGQGCAARIYLRLPDGTRIDPYSNQAWPLPADVNEAALVLPCLPGTLPGAVPENWELPLKFVPASPDRTVVPVIEIWPSPSPSPDANTPAVLENPLALTKVLDVGEHYILMGVFHTDASQPVGSSSSESEVTFTDANGQAIEATPLDYDVNDAMWPPSQPSAEPWGYQIDKGFAAPLTMTYTQFYMAAADPQARTEFEFAAGENPQPGQEWLLNQDLELGDHTFRLVSITADFREGYIFSLESDDPGVRGIRVEIAGYATNGLGSGGGDGGDGTTKWSERPGLNYDKRPKGNLKVVFFDLLVEDGSQTFQLQWSPDVTPPEITTPQP